MDKIFIKDLLVRGIIGINPDEREKPQDILISVEIFCDLRQAGKSDNISDTINYRTVAKQVMAHAETVGRFTAEALAEDIAQLCLGYPMASWVSVRVEKPAAARFCKTIGVEIERRRE